MKLYADWGTYESYAPSFFYPVNQFNLTIHFHSKEEVISPCQGRHGKYLKIYSRKFHVGVLASTWDLRHFVMPQISLCISENVCSRQSGTVPGSSREELPCELPLASLLQIVPENVRNCKNGMYCSMAERTSSSLLNLFREYISVFTIPQTPSTGQ